MDHDFELTQEQGNPYLAALWRKLLGTPGKRLFAQVEENLYVILQRGIASQDYRLVMAWGHETAQLAGIPYDGNSCVFGDNLPEILQNAKDKGFTHFITLEAWKTWGSSD